MVSEGEPPPAGSYRFVAHSLGAWLRADADWMHIPDIYAMTEEQSALHERLVLERDAYAMW